MTIQSDVLVLVDRSGVQWVRFVVTATVHVPGAALRTMRSKPEAERLPRNEGSAGLDRS